MYMVRLPLILLVVALLLSPAVQAELIEKNQRINGLAVDYRIVLPEAYDPERSYPAILAFSGGSQAENTVQMDLRRNWQQQAEQRGYIVVIAPAPEGRLFFRGGERIFPELLEIVLNDYRILDGKFHVAGPSNGGISAFTVAALHPEYFVSVTGFPGYLPSPTPERMEALRNMCIFMFAGERDRPWREVMEEQTRAFENAGLSVQSSVEEGQAHLIDSLANAGASRLFDQFDAARQGDCQGNQSM